MRRARHTGVLCALLAGLVLSGCTNAPAASADEEEAFAAPREIAVEQPQEAAQPEKKIFWSPSIPDISPGKSI